MKKRIRKIVEKWQHRFGLRDWDIETAFIDDVEFDGDYGRVDIAGIKMWARITLATKRKIRDIEATIIHEMIHIVHDDMQSVCNCFFPQLSNDCAVSAHRSFGSAEEKAVTRIVGALMLKEQQKQSASHSSSH